MQQDSPESQTTSQSGPAPVLVSRFRARDSAKVMPTNDTSVPLFTRSSPSATLQRSLESRLRARMDVNGSPEYVLTWKTWDMPSGPPICALRASAHRISGNDFGGWPTPQAQSTRPAKIRLDQPKGHKSNLEEVAALAGWPTPRTQEPGRTSKGYGRGLAELAKGKEQISGPTSIPSPVEMEKRGELNPEFVRWLMVFPLEWASCAPTAMPSSRKSRRNS